jgi:hypothetical protein
MAGDVAQLGEHLLCKQGVTGSSPVISTRGESDEIARVLLARIFDNRIRRFSSVARRCSPQVVVKLLRANGGCLGAGKRRRAWQAAISLGEPQAGSDPRMPEWGNPGGVMPTHP